MRAAIRGARTGALVSAGYAFAGYLGMIGLGKVVIPTLAGGDSYADLGLAALTLVVFAPMAGLAGSVVGFLPYRHRRLRKAHAGTFWAAVIVVVAVTAATGGLLDVPTALSALLVGLATLLVMRVSLVERQERRGFSG